MAELIRTAATCTHHIKGNMARLSSVLHKCCNEIHNGARDQLSRILQKCCNEILKEAMAWMTSLQQEVL